jgi:hypothetical protein
MLVDEAVDEATTLDHRERRARRQQGSSIAFAPIQGSLRQPERRGIR